ncbi:hypothetical protein D3C78_1213470 [compost metagenome]
MVTYDANGGSQLCPSPKTGLRPSQETLDFAHNWLFKVNALQAGIVHDTDMVPVDFNGYASQQERAAA